MPPTDRYSLPQRAERMDGTPVWVAWDMTGRGCLSDPTRAGLLARIAHETKHDPVENDH